MLILGKTDAKDNPEMLYNGCERDKGSNARLSGSATWLDRFVPEMDQVWLFLFVTVCIKKTQNTSCNAGKLSNFMHPSRQ